MRTQHNDEDDKPTRHTCNTNYKQYIHPTIIRKNNENKNEDDLNWG
jgi:hypothetical protein